MREVVALAELEPVEQVESEGRDVDVRLLDGRPKLRGQRRAEDGPRRPREHYGLRGDVGFEVVDLELQAEVPAEDGMVEVVADLSAEDDRRIEADILECAVEE